MRTITFAEEIEIDAPSSIVWSILADHAADHLWRRGVISMVPSTVGSVVVGMTTVEHLRVGGRTYVNQGVVTAVDSGASFTWRTTSGAVANGERRVTAIDGSRCRVRLEMNVDPNGGQRLIAPVLSRVLRRNIRGDLRRLADLAISFRDARQPGW